MPTGPDIDQGVLFARAFEEITAQSPDGIILYAPEPPGLNSPGDDTGSQVPGADAPLVEFRRIYVNDAAERILGLERADLLDTRVSHRSFPPLGPKLQAILTRIHHEGGAFEVSIEAGEAEGWHAYRIRGRRAGNCVVLRLIDITERERSRRALRRREIILQGVAETAEMLLDSEWEEVLPRVLEILGRATAVRSVRLVRHAAELGASTETVAAWGEPEAPGHGSVCVPFTVRGAPWGALLLGDDNAARRWSDGELDALRSAAFLLSTAIQRELREAEIETQLWQAQKLDSVGRLAGGVAHDFNNLLTVIQGNTELAFQTMEAGEIPEGELGEVAKAAERGARLSQQLLAFSRRQILQPVTLDLNRTARELTELFAPIIGHHVEVRMELASDLWPVVADPGQMEQVIMNLVLNARDAMPRGGSLVVETANVELDGDWARSHVGGRAGEHVLLAVTDEGHGIPASIRERIFEPFFTTKPHGEGTGLGLSTVYGVVKQSRGSIYVYSEPGRGTTFKVYLPRLEEASDSRSDSLPSGGALTLEGTESILIVEDEPGVLRIASRILRRLGYTVEGVQAPSAAIAVLSDGDPPDLLLTDVILPERTGRELAHEVQALHPGIRVLFMSGYSDGVMQQRGMLEPGVNFLEKPFTPLTLGRAVRQALGRAN